MNGKTLPRAAAGQATTEFLVLALVLVPLALAIPLLGGYIDMLQSAEQASRYVAFEGVARNSSSTWKTDAEMSVEVRRRFFSNSDAPIKTNDAAGDFAAHRNPLWSDAGGKAFLEKFSDNVVVETSVASKNAIAATWPFAGDLGLSRENLYTGQVTVGPVKLSSSFLPFDTLELTTRRKTVLLVDAWTARNVGTIKGSIVGATTMLPTQLIAPIIDLVGEVPPLVFDPALRLNSFDWDVVPCDRLIGGC